MLEPVWLGRAGPGCAQSGLDLLGGLRRASVSNHPLLLIVGSELKALLKQGEQKQSGKANIFLITVSSKLLFAVNGRKWEKHVVAVTQHRLYCWKRDLVHTFL